MRQLQNLNAQNQDIKNNKALLSLFETEEGGTLWSIEMPHGSMESSHYAKNQGPNSKDEDRLMKK